MRTHRVLLRSSNGAERNEYVEADHAEGAGEKARQRASEVDPSWLTATIASVRPVTEAEIRQQEPVRSWTVRLRAQAGGETTVAVQARDAEDARSQALYSQQLLEDRWAKARVVFVLPSEEFARRDFIEGDPIMPAGTPDIEGFEEIVATYRGAERTVRLLVGYLRALRTEAQAMVGTSDAQDPSYARRMTGAVRLGAIGHVFRFLEAVDPDRVDPGDLP